VRNECPWSETWSAAADAPGPIRRWRAAIHGLEAETAALLARRWRPWLDEDDVNDAAAVEIAGAGTLTGVVGLPARQARTAAAVVSLADLLAAARLLARVAGAP